MNVLTIFSTVLETLTNEIIRNITNIRYSGDYTR